MDDDLGIQILMRHFENVEEILFGVGIQTDGNKNKRVAVYD